ncbi:AAA family ATPase [Agathobaculum desmolans]|uniref:AAA family ATPase n=1 Tax=Agathobaculum desmolans TaxID=39484 RepID=UPI002941F70C|nr:AAA family ATPase [Agathobaculum desmolans]
MCKIIVMANQKGGVAKTSSTRNLAYSLAEMGQRVLAVDFDPQTNLTISFGIAPATVKESTASLMMKMLMDEALPDKDSYILNIGRVDLIPSKKALTVAEVNMLIERQDDCLDKLLSPLRCDYDYILVDTGPSLGSLTINAFNEKGHPHIHVVFWNKHQRTMVPFVHPSIPDKIRKQLIRDTFAERIKAYCENKQQAKEHLSAITDEMIDEFEQYMEQLHPQEYRRLREAFGRITDDELGTSPLDSVVGAMKIAPFLSRLFALKEKMPKKGRLYYKLLPEDVKAEVDALVAFLKENNEYIRNLVQDYVESKTCLAMLYDADPAHLKEQQEKAAAEADKLIANKILDVIRTMLRKDREVQSFEYTEARKAYLTEQMICEILMALEQAAMSFDMEYDDRQKAMSTELSKAARKEWYLRHKDKGIEP